MSDSHKSLSYHKAMQTAGRQSVCHVGKRMTGGLNGPIKVQNVI